tara:strand:- start:15531 stop:15890 length:360 start_codon:yes stop_codon:yes gene_type:complete
MYTPHFWLPVKITSKHGTVFKIFGVWRGGYLDGDSWRLNSGIKSIEEDDEYFYVEGYSGSLYKCYKDNQSTTGYGAAVLEDLTRRLKEQGVTLEVIEDIKNEDSIHVRPTSGVRPGLST